MPAAFVLSLSRLFTRRPSLRDEAATRRAEIDRKFEQLRARKRSYLAQLDYLDAHASPLDARTLSAREQVLNRIAEAVSIELDLLDERDRLDGLLTDFEPSDADECHTENEIDAAMCARG